MKSNILIFFKIFIIMFIASILEIKVTGGKFKMISPISWENVFSYYMTDILIRSVIISVVLFVAYLLIDKKKGNN